MSTDLVVPETEELARSLPSAALYQLEQAGQIAASILDERVIEWTKAGWSVRKIADEIGCSKSEVNRRQVDLDVRSSDPRGGVRALSQVGTNDTHDAEEVEPDEVLPPTDGFEHYEDSLEYATETAASAQRPGRHQLISWFAQGRVVMRLVQDGELTEVPRDLQGDVDLMIDIANRLKEG